MCVCRQKTRLFAVLPLENRHEIALYRSASQFIFFERCLWRAVCTKNNVDVVKLILGRVARGRGLVGVTYVGVAYTKWIVVVLLCSCLLVTGHPSVSVRVTVSKSLCLCH